MNAILIHQTNLIDGKDVFVIDSVVSEYNGKQDQKVALDIINNKEAKTNYSTLKFIERGCSKSLSIKVGKDSKSIYITSHFLSKDESNRPILYYFWMDSCNNPVNVRRKLEEYARLANMEINPADTNAIEIILSIFPKVKVGIITFGIILLMVLIGIILK